MKNAFKKLAQRWGLHGLFLSPERLVYYDMLRERDGPVPRDFSALAGPGMSGMVSVVLPVCNGERYLAEAVDSVLAQTYAKWELIIVDDGSTDNSPAIAEEYAHNDARIRCIRQENAKLPAALNSGHRAARGEFLTWISDDNRFKPDFLAVMTDELRNRPAVDFLFANLEVIDHDGKPTGEAAYYRDYQCPAGSGKIQLPSLVSRLHAWNSIGAAFMYRRRLLPIVGLYSEYRFGCEDYDFWLRINACASIRHTRHRPPLYQYRVHGASLTASGDAIGIPERMNALRVFHDARRDVLSGPVAWRIECDEAPACREVESRIREAARRDLLLREGEADSCQVPVCYVQITDSPDRAASQVFGEKPARGCTALLYVGTDPPPSDVGNGWDMCLWAAAVSDAPPDAGVARGWLATGDKDVIWHALRARAGAAFCEAMEDAAFNPANPACALSVVICTNRKPAIPARALASLMHQTFHNSQYEVILVNNDPGSWTILRSWKWMP